MGHSYAGVMDRLSAVGVRPDDSPSERLQKTSFTLAAVSITVLASLWVGIYWSYGLVVPALIPFIYQVCAVVTLVWFAHSGRFRTFRTVHVFLMLVLPVALQLSLGGFVNSSGVMLWAFMAPLGALLFGARSEGWFLAFAVLTVASGILDGTVAGRVATLPATVRVPFFVLNITAVCGTSFLLLRRTIRQRDRARTALEHEQRRSERLLLNVLPAPIAQRLKDGEQVIADRADAVTVLFADIAGFTGLAATLPPEEVVELLDRAFTELDRLADEHGLEKIKTIGDAYLAVAGIPEPQHDHAERVADMALAILDLFRPGATFAVPDLTVRVGIDTGPVVAGVIGRRRSAYDLWGDTVNTASRMESHGVPGRIHVTGRVRGRLGDRYLFERRGAVDIKGKGPMDTWFLVGRVHPTDAISRSADPSRP